MDYKNGIRFRTITIQDGARVDQGCHGLAQLLLSSSPFYFGNACWVPLWCNCMRDMRKQALLNPGGPSYVVIHVACVTLKFIDGFTCDQLALQVRLQ